MIIENKKTNHHQAERFHIPEENIFVGLVGTSGGTESNDKSRSGATPL